MYKIMRMHNAEYLESLFSRYVSSSANMGEIKELTAPLMRTETGMKSFNVSLLRLETFHGSAGLRLL